MTNLHMEDDSHTEDELSGSLHDLFRTITSPSSPQTTGGSSWTPRTSMSENVASSSRSLPPTGSTSRRATPKPNLLQQHRRTLPPPQDALSSIPDSSAFNNQVSPPPRSIFVSGPPTSSVSANTAHASLSTASASGSSLPLHALTGTGLGRRTTQRPIDLNISSPTIPALGIEKGVDDLNHSHDSNNHDMMTTSHKLSGLFATDADPTPHLLSRESTQLQTFTAIRSPPPDSTTLAGHLLYNGFLNGKHSDITVHAFGQSYKLHKLILDRSPYFSMAFCGPWTESSAQEMTIIPEDTDANITQEAFELALKRLYGTAIASHEEQEAIELFATACWLDMPDLVDICVDYILRQMNTSNLYSLIKLVTNSYYGRPGDRILASAKAMLCREGWEMPYEHWDQIPAEIIREVIGGDPFYVPGEWERWFLALKILNRRLRRLAISSRLVSEDGKYLHPKPQGLQFFAVRFDSTYRRDSGFAPKNWPERDDAWCSLYTSPDVSPLLVLLDEGIHYVHLRFEQLQHIRSARDALGVPVLPEKIMSDALWMQMELRQRVINAHDSDLELGLSEAAEEHETTTAAEDTSEAARGKKREDSTPVESTASEVEMDSGSWDGNGQLRKFWIPTADVSCIIGGVREAVASPAMTSSGDWTAGAARLSASLEPSDVTWAVDFAGSMFDSGTVNRTTASSSPPRYSHYPPFRFSAEFPNPRTLKEKKRVYSQTVWYAGSMWNLYIQRMNTPKGQQLGIYLHRAKDKDPSDDPLAQFIPASVDDRIGQLEREMLLRKSNNRIHTSWHDSTDIDDQPSSTHEFGPNTSTLLSPSRSQSYHDPENNHKTSQTPTRSGIRPDHERRSATTSDLNSTMLDPDSPDVDASLLRANQRLMSSIATMPPYNDTRATIKTYFKIYSPSKAGRLLSVYESAPDSFNFGKSWGWKTSQMVLDDGVGYETGTTGKVPTIGVTSGGLSGKEGKLRYMVVIGNV